MSNSTNNSASNFTTNHYLIYMIATALLMGSLLYSIGATKPVDYASKPNTGIQGPVVGEGAEHQK